MQNYSLLLYSVIFLPVIIDWIVELLNLSVLTSSIPKNFKKLYSPKKYKKSQDYLKATTIFGLIESTVSLIFLFLFIFNFGFNIVDKLVKSFALNEIFTGILFFLFLLLLNKLVSIPFDLYKTFVIEEKFGFNKQTPKVFVVDLLKSMVLESVLGGLIFGLILVSFKTFGDLSWVAAWILTTVIQIVLQFVYPVLIMPIFNKFTPLPNGQLKTQIMNFAKKEKFALNGIFTMDGSKRSTKSNAFFTGFGKFRRIVLFDTLIKQHTTDELVAVLAHEIGHFKKKHILWQLVISIILTGITFYVLSKFLYAPIVFEVFNVESISLHASIVFLSFLLTPAMLPVSIFANWLSRKFEYQADAYAVQTYKKPKALIEALKKLTVHNLSNLHPHPIKVIMDYSHPPVLERINGIMGK